MRRLLPQCSHNCSHITRKRGVYHYRRRLPAPWRGEVSLSLGTRGFREAEYRAELLDDAFSDAWRRTVDEAKPEDVLGPILREYLREKLNEDLQRRLERPPGTALYSKYWRMGEAPGTSGHFNGSPQDRMDLKATKLRQHDLARDLARNTPEPSFRAEAAELMREHGLPERLLGPLTFGLVEAAIEFWKEAEKRTLGEAPLVFREPAEPAAPPAPPPAPPVAPAEPKPEAAPAATATVAKEVPLASTFIDAFFERRRSVKNVTHQVIGQERGTIRRFLEVCGDRPVNAYNRGDITTFMDTLRRLPATYGKSPKDKDRPLADIIAEADTEGAERLTEKTVKRHTTALSQFFKFFIDRGLLTVAAHVELFSEHEYGETKAAREQRDAWTSEELRRLFSSPIWTGCHPVFRSQPGPEIIRDSKFWLPILALFHGARLEEFADLYRRDVDCEDGLWFIRITEAGGRRLKTDNAERVVPIHPEVLRLGFLDYVRTTAPKPDDPLFPDLEPQGADRRRGPRMTRFFRNYREQVGLYRDGVAMHAFRHTANTRLRDAITTYQQERHVNYLFGHSQGGGEGAERYDKGPGLKAVAETLSLLRYPELDFSPLYVPEATGAAEPDEATAA